MKLYIPELIIQKINDEFIEKYCIVNDDILEIYSDTGVYQSKNNSPFKKITIIDGEIKCIDNYIGTNRLFIDESFVYKSKYPVSRIPIEHQTKRIQHKEYKVSMKSPVTLVIEKSNNKIQGCYFMLTAKHGKYSIPDIKNQFTQETIEMFLDMMTK